MLDKIPRFVIAIVRKSTSRAIFSNNPTSVGEDDIVAWTLQENQRTVAEKAIVCSHINTLMTGKKLALVIGIPLVMFGCDLVFRLGQKYSSSRAAFSPSACPMS